MKEDLSAKIRSIIINSAPPKYMDLSIFGTIAPPDASVRLRGIVCEQKLATYRFLQEKLVGSIRSVLMESKPTGITGHKIVPIGHAGLTYFRKVLQKMSDDIVDDNDMIDFMKKIDPAGYYHTIEKEVKIVKEIVVSVVKQPESIEYDNDQAKGFNVHSNHFLIKDGIVKPFGNVMLNEDELYPVWFSDKVFYFEENYDRG